MWRRPSPNYIYWRCYRDSALSPNSSKECREGDSNRDTGVDPRRIRPVGISRVPPGSTLIKRVTLRVLE